MMDDNLVFPFLFNSLSILAVGLSPLCVLHNGHQFPGIIGILPVDFINEEQELFMFIFIARFAALVMYFLEFEEQLIGF